MVKRLGFVSNSSSSSFIICAKEKTLEEALSNHYEEIMGFEENINTNSYYYNFLKDLKNDWILYLCNMNDNSTTFEYDEPNPDYCREKETGEICYQCPKRSHNCRKNIELSRLSSLDEFKKVFDKPPNKEIVNIFEQGFNMFNLEIYSDGDGPNVIQQSSRFNFPTLDHENIKIFPENNLYED
jgi:hypothetical protein